MAWCRIVVLIWLWRMTDLEAALQASHGLCSVCGRPTQCHTSPKRVCVCWRRGVTGEQGEASGQGTVAAVCEDLLLKAWAFSEGPVVTAKSQKSSVASVIPEFSPLWKAELNQPFSSRNYWMSRAQAKIRSPSCPSTLRRK